MIWVYAQSFSEKFEVEVAKARAVMIGVSCVLPRGVRWIVIEVNSQLVYFALKKETTILSHFGGLIVDILDAYKRFDMVNFNWVLRTGNVVAHNFSRFAFSCNAFHFSSVIPETIVNFVNADLDGI